MLLKKVIEIVEKRTKKKYMKDLYRIKINTIKILLRLGLANEEELLDTAISALDKGIDTSEALAWLAIGKPELLRERCAEECPKPETLFWICRLKVN